MSAPTGPFTEGQVAQLQGELGSNLDYDDLARRYQRLGSIVQVIAEVLRIRLADARERPTSFNVAGEYSEDRGASVKLLAERVGTLDTELGADPIRIVRSSWDSPERSGVAYDSEERHLRRRHGWGDGGR